ncbi:hypothetical protein BDV24DRAFT_170229 [Aspergillus arachidicola]|uniref:Uncharacterized protein n=1 Tax=Aspergillus arachidicola TaxID=656916 RepID=A0A5N6XMC3_9EURO|nr:hypothetical protein BDV24DRAFT_170229 [Aspergillus arachidicola]
MASEPSNVAHSPHAPARIETLPTEIIQIIHIYALEPNFARASAVIAKVVSRKSFYDIFLIHAFWYDLHEISQAEGQSHCCLLPPWYQRLSFDEQCRLQDQVIHCRWFTAERLQETMQSLFDLTSRSISCARSYGNMDLLSVPLMAMQSWREMLGHEPPLRWPERRDGTSAWEKTLRVPVARLFTIPNKILRGPWSLERDKLLRTLTLELLRSLLWSRTRSVAGKPHLPRPTLDLKECYQGVADAISEHQHVSFYYLLRILRILGPAEEPVRLPESLFCHAIRHHPHSSTYLWPLIETSTSSLPDCVEVHLWAAAARARGDPLGLSIPEIVELNRLCVETRTSFCSRVLSRIQRRLVRMREGQNGNVLAPRSGL